MFDQDREAPKGTRGRPSAYRWKSNGTLLQWREEIREEIKALTDLIRSTDTLPGEREGYLRARWRLCGRVARITSILRDRWAE